MERTYPVHNPPGKTRE